MSYALWTSDDLGLLGIIPNRHQYTTLN